MRQLTFGEPPRAATEPERRRAAVSAIAIAESVATSDSPARDGALRLLEADLEEFLAGLGPGAEFQSSDFTAWLERNQRSPDPDVLDPRCSGGLIVRLFRRGRIEPVGIRPNGGCRETGYHSTPRRVWRVR